MCTTCGCESGGGKLEGRVHRHADGTVHSHEHPHEHTHSQGAIRTALRRSVSVERSLLAANDAHAQANRTWFAERGLLALNLVSSPGSGKTTLLTAAIARLQGRRPVAVIEGDQQTTRDAERIRAAGAPALQINTGKACHLDAHLVGHAAQELDLARGGVLFIENVGNLVCPAAFDLGEAHKVVILSVTEGEDKPLKYPDMFAAASLMLLNKVDLLPHLHFDVSACLAFARQVNPALQVIQTSATTGEGLDAWLAWMEAEVPSPLAAQP